MNKLLNFRKRIDRIDSKLAILLRKREKIIRKIGLYKKKNEFPVKNSTREIEILKKLDSDFEKNVFAAILKESNKIQSGH